MTAKKQKPVAAPQDVRPIVSASVSGSKVVIGLKLPNGLKMHLCDFVDDREPVPGGERGWKRPVKRPGSEIEIFGTVTPLGSLSPRTMVVGGYALTEGVDREYWKAWLEQNAQSDIVKNNLIFAEETRESAIARAKELSAVLSGLEPMRTSKDPRAPKPLSRNITEIEAADTKAA